MNARGVRTGSCGRRVCVWLRGPHEEMQRDTGSRKTERSCGAYGDVGGGRRLAACGGPPCVIAERHDARGDTSAAIRSSAPIRGVSSETREQLGVGACHQRASASSDVGPTAFASTSAPHHAAPSTCRDAHPRM